MRIARTLITAAFFVVGLAATCFVVPAKAVEDTYPARPITILVPFPPGGSSDIVMRIASQKAAEVLKQPIIIENRPGGAGNLAALAIKHAPPDGYLLMMGHTGTHAINPTLYSNLDFDPITDFEPITPLIAFNNILLVPAGSPAKSVKELVELAKSKPEGLSYGSQGVGTGGHLLGVIFAKHAGIKLLHVPYRGIAPAVIDAVAGRVDFIFSSYLSSAGYIESGKLRMLAIAGSARHPRIPDVPTMAEAGYPDVQMQQWFGLFAPAGTPRPIVEKLNAAFVSALNREDVKGKLLPQVAFVISGSPEDLARMVKRDIVRLGQLVRDSGAHVEQ
jgi:tripartite-type tricarboxylate transporter receptor subunit TctC